MDTNTRIHNILIRLIVGLPIPLSGHTVATVLLITIGNMKESKLILTAHHRRIKMHFQLLWYTEFTHVTQKNIFFFDTDHWYMVGNRAEPKSY